MTEKSFNEPTNENSLMVMNGDTRTLIKEIPDNAIQCAITSPPY